MYEVGSIIIIKNIIFKNGNRCYDHCYKKGRPCLVVALNDDKVYFLTLTSNLRDGYDHFEFIGNDYIKKKSVVNIESIYCREAFYYEEVCKIDNNDLLRILLKLCEFQNMFNMDDQFLEVKQSIEETIKLLAHDSDMGKCKCKI